MVVLSFLGYSRPAVCTTLCVRPYQSSQTQQCSSLSSFRHCMHLALQMRCIAVHILWKPTLCRCSVHSDAGMRSSVSRQVGTCAYKNCHVRERQGLTLPLFFLTSLRTMMRMMLNTSRAPPSAMIRIITGIVSPLLSRHHLLHTLILMMPRILTGSWTICFSLGPCHAHGHQRQASSALCLREGTLLRWVLPSKGLLAREHVAGLRGLDNADGEKLDAPGVQSRPLKRHLHNMRFLGPEIS